MSDKRIAVAVVLVFLVLAYGSVEAYLTGSSHGLRVPALTLALLGVMHGLVTERQRRPD